MCEILTPYPFRIANNFLIKYYVKPLISRKDRYGFAKAHQVFLSDTLRDFGYYFYSKRCDLIINYFLLQTDCPYKA